MALTRRTPWETKVSRFKLHCLGKERHGCAEKVADANVHTNKFVWGTFRMELYQDNSNMQGFFYSFISMTFFTFFLRPE